MSKKKMDVDFFRGAVGDGESIDDFAARAVRTANAILNSLDIPSGINTADITEDVLPNYDTDNTRPINITINIYNSKE